MSDALIIRLLSPRTEGSATAQWLMVDTTGGRLGVVIDGDLNEAAALAAARKVIVLVPGTEVHLSKPMLPVKRGMRLEQVTRYALEENLASDIDNLHFSLGKRHSEGHTPVAVIEHKQMETWLEMLHAAGIAPDAIYSEADVLPIAPAGVSAVIDGGLLYVQRGTGHGTALDVQPLSEALLLAFGGGEETLADALVYLSQAEYEAHAATLDVVRLRVPNLQTKLLPEGPLPLFALRVVQAGAVNLLSGNYARKKSWNKTFAPWRVAAMLLATVVVLHLTTSGLRYWQLARTEKQLDQQIRDVVAQALPGVQIKDTRKARQQFEMQLNALRDGGNSGGLLPSLGLLAATLAQVPDTRIDALAYRTKVIDLRITAPNVDALERIRQSVSEQGLHTELQSATPRDNKMEGRLQLKADGV